MDRNVVADLDRLAVALAAQKPVWEPGMRQGYHAITLGFYEGELLRRVDPRQRSLGQFFQDEIASPLGLDFYIRLPEEIPNSRLAKIQRVNPVTMILHPNPFTHAFLNPATLTFKAFWKNPGMAIAFGKDLMPVRNLEVPSQGGVGNARAIAHAYSVFATGGRELGLRQETLQALMAPAVPPQYGFYDECLKRKWQLSLGFAKPDAGFPFGSPSTFGTPGSGDPSDSPTRRPGWGMHIYRTGWVAGKAMTHGNWRCRRHFIDRLAKLSLSKEIQTKGRKK